MALHATTAAAVDGGDGTGDRFPTYAAGYGADMPGQFDGKVALVTGGARGIGRAICESLARDGADVAINFRGQVDAAEEVAAYVREHGGRAITVQADMGDPDAVATLIGRTRDELGPIDLLVNNAAYTHLLTHEELTFNRWQRFMRTNLDGPFLTMW